MKTLRFLPLLILTLLLGSCAKKEFSLKFSLPKDANTPCKVLYYEADKGSGSYRETVVEITNGKGEARLAGRFPSLIFFFSTSALRPSAIAYARQGDRLEVTGNGDVITDWTISGNEITDSLTAWRLRNVGPLTSGNSKLLNSAVESYVKDNPSSGASMVLLYVYYDRSADTAGFDRLLASLDRKVTDDFDLTRALSVADLMTLLPSAPKIPRSLILRSDSGFADTLPLAGRKSLLIFDGTRRSALRINTDSLKSLVERRGNGVVAEIIAEPDSMTWRRYLRNDTIKGLKRYWIPEGLADTMVIDLGIRKMPYYMVIGSDLKTLYRGTDWKEAAKKF